MKPGVTGLVLPAEWDFARTLAETKRAGYEALEVVLRDDGELSLESSPARLKELARRAADAGIELASMCPALRKNPVNLLTNDAALRGASVERVKRILGAAAGLGLDTVLLVMGPLTEDTYYDQAYANALAAMRQLGPAAASAGVTLAIEYVWNKFLLSPMEFRRFLDEVASPKVGFYFDPGNMAIFSYPEHWVRILAPYVRKVHMKDFRRNGFSWQPLGGGDVNFPAVMRELRAAGYDGPLISEVSTTLASLEETAQAIRRIIAGEPAKG